MKQRNRIINKKRTNNFLKKVAQTDNNAGNVYQFY